MIFRLFLLFFLMFGCTTVSKSQDDVDAISFNRYIDDEYRYYLKKNEFVREWRYIQKLIEDLNNDRIFNEIVKIQINANVIISIFNGDNSKIETYLLYDDYYLRYEIFGNSFSLKKVYLDLSECNEVLLQDVLTKSTISPHNFFIFSTSIERDSIIRTTSVVQNISDVKENTCIRKLVEYDEISD